MTDEEINQAIAEWMGWKCKFEYAGVYGQGLSSWYTPDGKWAASPPNFCTDLNACHEAEMKFELLKGEFCDNLGLVTTGVPRPIQWRAVCATSHQRCEALLRTIGKWKE